MRPYFEIIAWASMLLGMAAGSVCIAESVNVSGKVTDIGGTPLPGAIVSLENGGQTATTGIDGSFTLAGTNVINVSFQAQPYKLSATIRNGLLSVNILEKSAVDIVAYTVQGKAVSRIQQTMDAGTHSIALPRMGTGVYFYKVKAGSNAFVLKSISIEGVSAGTALAAQGYSAYNPLAKQVKAAAAINDVIAAKKDGYLDYRETITNSDTSGIEIKMIAGEGTVTDADGNVYQTLKIGNQVWTVENLRTTKYNDGTAIPLDTSEATWTNASTDKYCYYNNTINAENIRKYGALYNWYTVNPANPKKIALAGWHVPTDAEWDTLQNYLIANGYNWDGATTGNMVAKAMAAKADWLPSLGTGAIGNDLSTNNRSGFSALPGGYRTSMGDFSSFGASGCFWSTTEFSVSTNAYYHYLYCGYSSLNGGNYRKCSGFSVRLVKDN